MEKCMTGVSTCRRSDCDVRVGQINELSRWRFWWQLDWQFRAKQDAARRTQILTSDWNDMSWRVRTIAGVVSKMA
jgi:hypothetical protein